MLQLIAPDVSNVEKHIRSLGVSSFPTGDTFWYEDIPQIPARLATQYFIVNTSEPGKQHQLFLNGREYKRLFLIQTYIRYRLFYNKVSMTMN